MSDEPCLLLDTCALIFASLDSKMAPEAFEAIEGASMDRRLRISPISAWEIGMLMGRGRLKSPLSPSEFLRRFLKSFNGSYAEMSPEILIDSSYLPASPHADPTDRILIATARALDMILVTRDRPILDYGSQGHLRTLAC